MGTCLLLGLAEIQRNKLFDKQVIMNINHQARSQKLLLGGSSGQNVDRLAK